MKIRLRTLKLCLLAGIALGSWPAIEARTWTSTEGETMKAIFLGSIDGKYYFQTPDKQQIALPSEHFIEADREAAERFAKIGDDAFTKASARKIDALLARNLKKAGFSSFNDPLPDDLFVRRVYLDIAGRIPTREEFLAFAEDSRPDKRDILIDELLLSPGYASHLFNYFGDMFRLRAGSAGGSVHLEPYFEWWKQQIRDNRPYDEIITELITAKGNLGQNPASGFLLRDRGMEVDSFSNFTQTMLGIDLSCAQCHDHPFEDWTQGDFYNLFAFFGKTHRSGKDPASHRKYAPLTMLPNAPEAWLTDFQEFAKKQALYKNPDKVEWRKMVRYIGALTSGISDAEIKETKYPHDFIGEGGVPGEIAKPTTLLGAPAEFGDGVSRREALAAWLTSRQNPRFALTIANRMWDRAFGTPLVGPVNNVTDVEIRKSAQTEVLKYITTEMIRVDFDLREFARILYNTRAYQSISTAIEPQLAGSYAFQGPLLRRMRAEQAWDSLQVLQHGVEVDQNKGFDASFFREAINIDPETMSFEDVWERYKVWSKLNYGVRKAMVKSDDFREYELFDPIPLRASEMHQPAPEESLLSVFGQSDRVLLDNYTVIGSVPQVLTLMNGEFTEHMVGLTSSIVQELSEFDGPDDQARGVFFTLLNRFPTSDELNSGVDMIEDFGNEGISDLAWSLINSPEFLFIQ